MLARTCFPYYLEAPEMASVQNLVGLLTMVRLSYADRGNTGEFESAPQQWFPLRQRKGPDNVKAFPVFRLLEVKDYGLYPGPVNRQDGLRIKFCPGLTLVVGANGLGKTTLITLIFRMLAGPFDIPQLRSGVALGYRRLEAKKIPLRQRKMFAARVSDRATRATARLEVSLGSIPVTIERSLSNLILLTAQVGDKSCETEECFQAHIMEAAGLGSFGDFILMLRYLVFYFEDRRQLVWDPSAQRQLLRMLYLPPDLAQRWTSMERSILANDSRMRNFRAVVGREEKHLTKALAQRSDVPSLRAELQTLETLQESDRTRLNELEGSTEDLDQHRQEARLAYLRAKQERETRFRALEYAKLLAIDARFPGKLETGRYMLTHLLSENACLLCGTVSPQAAQEYANRLSSDRCLVCDTPLSSSDRILETRIVADKRVARAERNFKAADRELIASTRERQAAETQFDHHNSEMTQLRSEIATRTARLAQIVKFLPPKEADIRKQRMELASIRGRLESMKSELTQERLDFHDFVKQCSEDLFACSESIVESFTEFASKFLSEKISLTWTSRAASVGQGGQAIPFPAFELNMSGGDFVQTVRRTSPNDVSESQREFIDLSFRMALMRTAGSSAAGLVIDAPESSLDAVFAKRAGETLIGFSKDAGNTVVVTSNLIEGNLLPTLIKGISVTPEKRARLVDLIEVAHPTAAVTLNQVEYNALRHRLFKPLS